MGTDSLGKARLAARPLVRAFFGLPLPDGQRAALDGFLADCAARAKEFRWTPAANLHLTIRFLGDVEPSLAEGLADRLTQAELGRFDLRLGELGAFQRGRFARVVWLGVKEGADDIGALAGRVEAECVQAGLEAEARRYHAHLTLARARPREGAILPALPPAPTLPPWTASELILYRSRLGRGGSVYEPLRRVSLR